MLRSIRQKLNDKLFGNNLLLNYVLANRKRSALSKKSNLFRKLSSALLKLYLIPVRNILTINYAPEFYYTELHKLMHISKVKGFDLIRIGSSHDGGYILLNDFHENNIAYSFGISNDVSWDKDMALNGYDVFMYDHTINGLPENNSRFHFFKLGIGGKNNHDERLKTLEELIAKNNHQDKNNMILKMDVEGAEWGFFESVSSETLSQFSQMTFEFHGMDITPNPEKIINILRKINKTHKLIHLHANNNGSYVQLGGKKFCSLLEVTYVLKSKYDFIDDYDVDLPLSLDEVNIDGIPEIELGRWNEKMSSNSSMYSLMRVK